MANPIQHYANAQATFQIPHVANGNVFLGDIAGAPSNAESPVSCGFFRMTKGDAFTCVYPYQEALHVVSGSFNMVDGLGNKSVGKPRDVYYFPADSKVTFSSDQEGLAFYAVQRAKKWICR